MQIGEIFDPSSSTPLKKTGQVTPQKIVLIFDQFWVIFQRCGLDENIDGDKKRLKNHKEGRIFLLAKFGVFWGFWSSWHFVFAF